MGSVSSGNVHLENLVLRHRGYEQAFDHSALEVINDAQVRMVGCGATCPDGNCITIRGQNTSVVLKKSQVYEGGRCGIEVLAGARCTLEGCKITRNGWSGVEVANAASVSIEGCTIARNAMYGMHFKDGSRGVLSSNRVSHHSSIWGDMHVDSGAQVESDGAVVAGSLK